MSAIDLKPFLDSLRKFHGVIYVAVISEADYARYQAIPATDKDLLVLDLPDGRATISTLNNLQKIRGVLDLRNITPDAWVELVEYDERFEEEAYVGNIDGRHVRIQTGMLDDLFGFIAVQSAQLDDVATAIEGIRFKALTGFEENFEKLASPSLVRQ